VIEAASGGAALEQLHYDLPDVLVIDPLLPDVDGFALIEQVRTRSDGEALSILVVTAKELNESDRGRLNGNIRSVLAKRRLTQEGLHQYLGALGLVQL
jgi:DNA-binding response OmpR family regulator